MRIVLSALLALVLWVLPASAASPKEAPPGAAAIEEQKPEESYGLTGLEEGPKPDSSVNIREEYGFGHRQNIDSFLGEYENPYAPLSEDSTYEGSRSESRQEIDEHRI